MRPRAVLIDLDETLIAEEAPRDAAFREVARRAWNAGDSARGADLLRLAADEVWRTEAPHRAFTERLQVGADDGLSARFEGDRPELADLRAFLPRFRARAFAPALPPEVRHRAAELAAVWRTERLSALTVYPDAEPVLASLRRACRVAAVTNGPKCLQREKLAVTGLGRFFDVVVTSVEVGVGKPHPAMFRAALRALQARPDEAVMVGNDLTRDIRGAQAVGIRSIWVRHDPPEQACSMGSVSDLGGVLRAIAEL